MTALVIKAHQSQVNFEVFLASMLLMELALEAVGLGLVPAGLYLDREIP